jgi:hypothetical protein
MLLLLRARRYGIVFTEIVWDCNGSVRGRVKEIRAGQAGASVKKTIRRIEVRSVLVHIGMSWRTLWPTVVSGAERGRRAMVGISSVVRLEAVPRPSKFLHNSAKKVRRPRLQDPFA